MSKIQLILLCVYAGSTAISYALSIILLILYRKSHPKAIKQEKGRVRQLKDKKDYRLVIRGNGGLTLSDNTYKSKNEAKKALKKTSAVLYKNGNRELTYEIVTIKVKR